MGEPAGNQPGEKWKLLFVCWQNRHRSPTAEKLFEKSDTFDARSAGLDADAVRPLDVHLLEWADVVFTFERAQVKKIRRRFKSWSGRSEIICLFIPDEFGYMDPALLPLLEKRLARYLRLKNSDTDAPSPDVDEPGTSPTP